MARKKTKRQLLRDECEKLCREIVFERDNFKCLRCGTGDMLQWSHVIRRSRSTRLICQPCNSKVMCRDCHCWWTNNEVLGGLWFGSVRPEQAADVLRIYEATRKAAYIPIVFWEDLYAELDLLALTS